MTVAMLLWLVMYHTLYSIGPKNMTQELYVCVFPFNPVAHGLNSRPNPRFQGHEFYNTEGPIEYEDIKSIKFILKKRQIMIEKPDCYQDFLR